MRFFLIIFFALYAALNFYVLSRASQSLQFYPNLRIPIIILAVAFGLSFFIHNIFEQNISFDVNKIFYSVGSIWLIAVMYFFMAVLFLDIIRLANHFFNFLPNLITQNYVQAKFITLCAVVGIVGVVFAIGYINFKNPKIVNLDITLKNIHQNKELNIVVASDLHLGYTIDKKMLQKYVEIINELKPDIILLLGDIADRSSWPIVQQNMKDDLLKLHSKYGTYAIEGNHELMDNLENLLEYFKDSGIIVLRDSIINIDEEIFIIGRKDRGEKNRLSIAELIKDLDKNKATILLDHQPFNLEESEKAGIDLQLSGHTHNGQIFPNNLIVNKIYEIAYGYLRKGNTQYYVSSGLGLWGAPLRICSQSELVSIKLKY